jgi:hypothetical protein
MRDQRVCRMHGGSSPRALAAAEQRRQEREAGELLSRVWRSDAAPVKDAVGEMQRLAGSMRSAVDVLGNQLDIGAACDSCGRGKADLESATSVAWIRVLRELRQLLSDMQRLGIAEQLIQVEAAKVRLMSLAFGKVLDELGLDEEQRELATRVLLTEMRALESAEPDEHDVVAGEAS